MIEYFRLEWVRIGETKQENSFLNLGVGRDYPNKTRVIQQDKEQRQGQNGLSSRMLLHLCDLKITEMVKKKSESFSTEKQLLHFIHFFYLALLSHSKNSLRWRFSFLRKHNSMPFKPYSKNTTGKKGRPDILSIFYAESHLALIPGSLKCSYGLLVRGGLLGQVIYGFLAQTPHIRYSRYKDPVCVYILGTLMHSQNGYIWLLEEF